MGLVYLPYTFTINLSHSWIGKYSSDNDPLFFSGFLPIDAPTTLHVPFFGMARHQDYLREQRLLVDELNTLLESDKLSRVKGCMFSKKHGGNHADFDVG